LGAEGVFAVSANDGTPEAADRICGLLRVGAIGDDVTGADAGRWRDTQIIRNLDKRFGGMQVAIRSAEEKQRRAQGTEVENIGVGGP
jgi:hypothetical protein